MYFWIIINPTELTLSPHNPFNQNLAYTRSSCHFHLNAPVKRLNHIVTDNTCFFLIFWNHFNRLFHVRLVISLKKKRLKNSLTKQFYIQGHVIPNHYCHKKWTGRCWLCPLFVIRLCSHTHLPEALVEMTLYNSLVCRDRPIKVPTI